jgi:hypothetical protein
VERVGHHDAIQRRQVEGLTEVAEDDAGRRLGEAMSSRVLLAGERRAVLVDREDQRRGTDQLGERAREGAVAGAEVGPDATRAGNARPDQPDEVFVLQECLRAQLPRALA